MCCVGVGVGVGVYGYAFRSALRNQAETWHGGMGTGPRGLRAYFRSDPPKVKGHPEVKLL